MVPLPGVPSFPSEGVAAKALELGFGSGPWSRAEMAERWSESSANRFISEAKGAGWLISPFRDEFYVLPARDLAVVGWLPSFEREEFVVSRMLAALGVRYWCLSEWARQRGLLFPQPLFVSDLAPLPDPLNFPPPMLDAPSAVGLSQEALRRVSSWGRLPFLDNLIIVPVVPQTRRSARVARTVLPVGGSGRLGATTWGLEAGTGEDAATSLRVVPYALAPDVDDPAWIAALLFSLGLPRADELLESTLREAAREDPALRRRASRKGRAPPVLARRFERWAATFAAPAKNDAWRSTLSRGAPFLLVPEGVAAEIGASEKARRFEDLRQMKEWFDAGP